MQENFFKHHKKEAIPALKAAFPKTLPILTGFLFIGMAYGVLMESKGYGVLWSFLMSAIAFGGSMQYVAVTLLTIPFDPVNAFLLSLMVNARHLFYGLSMLKKYKGLGFTKGFLIYVLCDETYSIVSSAKVPEGISRKWFYFWISFLDYSYWVLATILGGLLGSVITIELKGIDFVLTALFVVIFLEQIRDKEKRIPAVVGVLVSLLCLVIFGMKNFIIPSMLGISLTLGLLKRNLEQNLEQEERECI